MSARKLRNADNMLKELNKNFHQEYEYLISKANEKDFYLGIRNNRVILYYLGSKVGEIRIVRHQITGKPETRYYTDKYYSNDPENKYFSFNEYKKLLDNEKEIKRRVEEYTCGKRKDKKDHKTHFEKMCQQWILNNYNNNPLSKWYIADMEYADGVPETWKRFGRFDLIAIRKEKVNSKYPVALIELKVGSGAFIASKSTSKKGENDEERINKSYEVLMGNLYTDQRTIKKVTYGSGLVSHIADYLRYLYFRDDLFCSRLKTEIITSIKTHQDIGVLDKALFKGIQEDDICDYPDIYFAMYTDLPRVDELKEVLDRHCKNANGKKEKLSDIKRRCYHYLYVSKNANDEIGYCIQRFFGNQLDGGFTKKTTKDKLKAMINDDGNNEYAIKQPVKGQDHEYTFNMIFIDSEKKDSWDFL